MHIDCTEDLSTASFMLCFERFINRRGFPQHVYSDNGFNFIGAARTLGTPTQLPYDLQDFTAKTADLQVHGVSWHFIPSRSPHCGGIWESGIRRMKEELRKTLHHLTPTAAVFYHLLITAEAVLNSRPLLPISLEEADGAQVITPGHFLIGRPIRAYPQDIPPPKDRLRKVRWSLLSYSGITYRLASLDIQIDYNSCPWQSGQHYNLPAKLLWKDCGLYRKPTS